MKETLVRGVRKILPKGLVRLLEEGYRRSRVWLISARYGFPARGLRVIAVTGTNGKTTTVAYINSILKAAGHTTAMFGTATIEVAGESKLNDTNTTVATTATMQRFFAQARQAKVDFVVLEVTSQALDQHKLDSVPIEAAVMTNLTQDHLDYHHTMEAYADAKARLFQMNPRLVVLNRDDEWYKRFSAYAGSEMTMSYGTDTEADCRIASVQLYKDGSDIQLIVDHQTELALSAQLPGKFNVYNVTAAAAVAYLLHLDLEAIRQGVAQLAGVPGRQERIDLGQPYGIIVDYAHTPDALQQLLETLRHLTKRRLILVFGATGDRDRGKRPIMGRIASELADRIIVTDEESYNEDPASIRSQLMQGIIEAKGEARAEEVADRRAAIEKALSIARPDDAVVITGMGHEQFRVIAGQRLPWNDAQVVRDILGGH